MFHEDLPPAIDDADRDEVAVPPKTAFVLGFVTAVLSVGTMGFIVLLYAVLNA